MKRTLLDSKKNKMFKVFVLSIVAVGSSFAQTGKLSYHFNTDGNAESWITPTAGATATVSGGAMTITPGLQGSGPARRGDLQHSGGETLHAGDYPILAIRFNKPATCNVTLDTNLGKYKNFQNNWDGVINGNIYYYDLRNTFGTANVLSTTAGTTLTTFQFKIADITSAEANYSIDWVATFPDKTALDAYVASLGVNDIRFQTGGLKVYPNPSTAKFFNIDLKDYANDTVEVKVYDLLGKVVLEKTLKDATSKIDHNLSPGVYIVKVGNSAVKLVVQ